MAALIGIVAVVCAIGSIVCWILEIVAAFKNEESPLLGILSIVLCGLGGFIIGWIKHKEWDIKNIMLAWSGLIVVNIVLNILAAVVTGAQ